MGEFAKYVAFKQQADTLIYNYEQESRYVDSLLTVQKQKNETYANLIANLKASNNSKDIRLQGKNELLKLTEENFESILKQEKRKKWNWGAFGVIIGGLVGFLTALSL